MKLDFFCMYYSSFLKISFTMPSFLFFCYIFNLNSILKFVVLLAKTFFFLCAAAHLPSFFLGDPPTSSSLPLLPAAANRFCLYHQLIPLL